MGAIPIAILFDLWLGGVLAWCAAPRIRAEGTWAQPSITLVALLAAIVLCPVTAYLYLAHPDWSWLYLVDARRMPRLFVVPVAAAAAAALVGGYYGAARLLGGGIARRQMLILLGVAGLVVALALLVARARLFHYGSYLDYHAGRAAALFQVKLGFVLVALLVGVTAASLYTAWELLRDARRAGNG